MYTRIAIILCTAKSTNYIYTLTLLNFEIISSASWMASIRGGWAEEEGGDGWEAEGRLKHVFEHK